MERVSFILNPIINKILFDRQNPVHYTDRIRVNGHSGNFESDFSLQRSVKRVCPSLTDMLITE